MIWAFIAGVVSTLAVQITAVFALAWLAERWPEDKRPLPKNHAEFAAYLGYGEGRIRPVPTRLQQWWQRAVMKKASR